MKNIDSPSYKDFILTNKKKRMIKAEMNNLISSLMSRFCNTDIFSVELEEYTSYLKSRLAFLKNIKAFYAIEIINGTFTGLIFQYEDQIVFSATCFRKEMITAN